MGFREQQASLVRRLEEDKTGVPQAVRQVTGDKLAPDLLEKSQALCPVDTGDLVNSGHIEEAPNGFAVVYDSDHAVEVHDDLDRVHPDGQAKFLEQPAVEQKSEVAETWQGAANQFLRRA